MTRGQSDEPSGWHEGSRSGIDHFGIEVDDIEGAVQRIKAFDASLEVVERLAARPFAALSAHDPDTNVFDLSQRNIGVQKDVYAESGAAQAQPRYLSHVALRTRHAKLCARFYADVFGLQLSRKPDDENCYLSDGRVTLIVMPWQMSNFLGHNPTPLGIEHIGFTVESIPALKQEMEEILGVNPRLATWPLGHGPEAAARLRLFQRCPVGTYHLTDVEGVFIDVTEGPPAPIIT